MLPLVPAQADAQTISGMARVIDGDTIQIGSDIIRLEGMDAPELAQVCDGPKAYRQCGQLASAILAEWVEGNYVACEVVETDQYGRSVSRCVHRGREISAWMVEQGYALAFRRYSSRLVPQEDAARASGAGLWKTALEPPWEYRARRWRVADQEAPEGCPIKGNISLNTGERIYHAPWSPWYEKTRINTAKGERWFCTEGEALAAGWRPPKG